MSMCGDSLLLEGDWKNAESTHVTLNRHVDEPLVGVQIR
jgi:hypothetical protein